jgi:hypothetical protein
MLAGKKIGATTQTRNTKMVAIAKKTLPPPMVTTHRVRRSIHPLRFALLLLNTVPPKKCEH